MASSTIYNHRSLQPAGGAQGPPMNGVNRINESFDIIRQEFDLLASDLNMARAQRQEVEDKIGSHIQDIQLFQQKFSELEVTHMRLRQQYEEELSRLRQENHMLRQGHAPPGGPAPAPVTQPPAVAPPLAGPGTASRNPSDQYYMDRDRERERERERDRDYDRRDTRDMREPKRLKMDRKGPEVFSPSQMPKLPPPGATTPSSSQPPPPLQTGQMTPYSMPPETPARSFLDDLDPNNVPPELKKEGNDWFAIFNPGVKRSMDVTLVHTLMHESVVCCVRFSADGRYLATGCNRTAQIYDTNTGVKTCVLSDESAGKAGDLYIRSVCFSPDGKYLATGAEDKQIRIWDIAKKSIRNVFDGHQQEIYSLDFSSDGRLIVSGSGDKTARIWNMMDGTSKVLTISDPDAINNDAGVTSVSISPDGRYVAAGSLDTVVRIWDVQTGTLVERLRGHRDSVYSVAFTPDGRGLVSGSLDKTLKYWDVAALKRKDPNSKNGDKSVCKMDFLGHKDYVLSVAVSHDGQWVVSGSKDRGVQFWDSRTAMVQCMLQGHKNSVISIDLSPSGSLLATGSGDWQARIWSYTNIA